MKRYTLFLMSLAFAAASQLAPVGAATSTLTVPLAAENGSGETGTATLTQGADGVTVVISLKGAPATTPQPAHIHDGTCGAGLKGVVYPLANVVDGSSTTLVHTGVRGPAVTVDYLLKGPFAINVHESADNLGKYVACGNIAKAASSM